MTETTITITEDAINAITEQLNRLDASFNEESHQEDHDALTEVVETLRLLGIKSYYAPGLGYRLG